MTDSHTNGGVSPQGIQSPQNGGIMPPQRVGSAPPPGNQISTHSPAFRGGFQPVMYMPGVPMPMGSYPPPQGQPTSPSVKHREGRKLIQLGSTPKPEPQVEEPKKPEAVSTPVKGKKLFDFVSPSQPKQEPEKPKPVPTSPTVKGRNLLSFNLNNSSPDAKDTDGSVTNDSNEAFSNTSEPAKDTETKAEEPTEETAKAPEEEEDDDEVFIVKYNEECWRPENPDLPKIYSKEFLLQFRPEYYTVTDQLKSYLAEIIPSESLRKSKNLKSSRGGRRPNRGGKRRPRPGSNPNAWQRPGLVKDSTEKKKMEIQRYLNTITKDTFDEFIQKIVRTCYSNEEHVEILIDVLYTKAILESQYVKLYTKLCVELSKVPLKYDENAKFKTLLIKRCQHEFEQKQKPPELLEEGTIEEKIAVELKSNKIRERNDGNAIFVGQLYLHNLLSTKVILYCLSSLCPSTIDNIDDIDIFDLENFCKLMNTVGGNLDRKPKQKPFLDSLFDRIAGLSKNKKLGRIRFILMDLIDLRRRRWVEKRRR